MLLARMVHHAETNIALSVYLSFDRLKRAAAQQRSD
jgi:hypothetical protein